MALPEIIQEVNTLKDDNIINKNNIATLLADNITNKNNINTLQPNVSTNTTNITNLATEITNARKGKTDLVTELNSIISSIDACAKYSNFITNLNENGYIKIPTKDSDKTLLIQWTKTYVPPEGTVNFPISYPNAILGLSVIQQDWGYNLQLATKNVTTTGFKISHNANPTDSPIFRSISIGY